MINPNNQNAGEDGFAIDDSKELEDYNKYRVYQELMKLKYSVDEALSHLGISQKELDRILSFFERVPEEGED